MNKRELVQLAIRQCTKCDLHVGVTPVPFYSETADPKLAVIGHGPGPTELRKGVPWVGKTGKITRDWLQGAGIKNRDVVWLNVVCCGDEPKQRHIDACRSNLTLQMEALKPSYALVFGALAADSLLPTKIPLARLRGRWWKLSSGQWAIATFHPAATLYRSGIKQEVLIKKDILRMAHTLLLGDLMPPKVEETCVFCDNWAVGFTQGIGFCRNHVPARLRSHDQYAQLSLLEYIP